MLCTTGGVPTLRELISFPVAGGKVDLASKIGAEYYDFGVLLLEDDNGDEVDAIVKEFKGNAKDINRRILKLWLNGKGQPVTWSTLVGVLKDIQLNQLAKQIKSVKGLDQ